MGAWRKVRDTVRGRELEIDQMKMALCPGEIAEDICSLLDFDVTLRDSITTYLEQTRSEQTSAMPGHTFSLADTGWNQHQRDIFINTCAPMMAAYGYAFEAERDQTLAKPIMIPLTFVDSPYVTINSKSQKTRFWPERLTFKCVPDLGSEVISIRNIRTRGQNCFEGLLRQARSDAPRPMSCLIRLTDTAGTVQVQEIKLTNGTEQNVRWDIGLMNGPISIEISAEAEGNGSGLFSLDLIRPRLSFQS